jgi:tRNA threonylcarbamoyladenosine biosynthesis protein TsaE
MKTIIPIPSLQDLPEAAGKFLELAADRPVVAFSGEMGAGKTTFIQALCKEMGVPTEVNSPTFALVNEYFTKDGTSIFHFDLYRIDDPSELFDLGYEEYFYSGSPCFIEWPEKARHLIPPGALQVKITVLDDGGREVIFSVPGEAESS